MSFDARALHAEFPLLAGADAPLHYLDSAATSQIHRAALDAMLWHETRSRANVLRGTYRLAEAATQAYEDARRHAARFVNAAAPGEIVFTAGCTSALNLVAHSLGATLAPGDEVVVSLSEHHSNFVPWLMLRRRAGVALRFLPLTGDGCVDVEALAAQVTPRCRLIALTHCSNVTGAVPDVAAVVEAAHAVGARVLLDGAQHVQHGPIDVRALGVDFYAFSGHKCFGPGGIGVLWGRADALAALPPFLGGGGMVGTVTPEGFTVADAPRRLEAGTPAIAAAIGLGAALEWMMTLPWPDIHAHEHRLVTRLLEGLGAVPGVRVLGPAGAGPRQAIVAFNLAGLHPHDVCQVLDRHGVAVRGGHHCAQPLMRHFGVDGAIRASIALYTTGADIDALLTGLGDAIGVLG